MAAPINILVTGECGDGKSTLINALRLPGSSPKPLCGKSPGGVTKEVALYKCAAVNGVPLNLIDTPGIGDGTVSPIALIGLLDEFLKGGQIQGGIRGVVVTMPIPDCRIRLGAQIVQLLVDKGFVADSAGDKYANVILTGTKSDKADEDDKKNFMRGLGGKSVSELFFQQAKTPGKGRVAMVNMWDYSQLTEAIRSLPNTTIGYQAPGASVMADAVARRLGTAASSRAAQDMQREVEQRQAEIRKIQQQQREAEAKRKQEMKEQEEKMARMQRERQLEREREEQRERQRQAERERQLEEIRREAARLKNSAGAPVSLGTQPSTRHVYYCGRYMGASAIPGSDGHCGPNDGPQCRDCRGMQETLKNAAGVAVALGSGSCYNKYYCGRFLGTAAIPGSDGRCGPNNGPQCRDCRGMQDGSQPTNRAGAPVFLGTRSGTRRTYYCGRFLGRQAIPGSDGHCGPNDGPQCPDCRGLSV